MVGSVQRDDEWHQYFVDVAFRTSLLSYALRKKVGAIAVRDRRIICSGFNGTAPGRDNSCEKIIKCYCDETNRDDYLKDGWLVDEKSLNTLYKYETRDEVIHAERNLINYAAAEGIRLKDSMLYLTLSPCLACATSILTSGISAVIYTEQYRNTDGIDFLKESKIKTIHWKEQ